MEMLNSLNNQLKRFDKNIKAIKRNGIVVALELEEYGIIISSLPELNTDAYHFIYVDTDKLDDQIYVNDIISKVFWKLVEAGYLFRMRREQPSLFKKLLVEHGWAKKIIDYRLSKWNNIPKFKFLININKQFMQNLAININRDPSFFDTLWI